jgi:CHASE2 domain-containing sensor protein
MSIEDIADRELPHLVKVIEERKTGVFARLSKSKLALLVIAVLVFVFQVRGLPDKFAGQSLDAAVAVRAHLPADPVVLLVIDDEDYSQLFSETSPLNPEALSNLLEAIAAGGAKAVVVDIDTSSSKFATMKVPALPTVWAMVGTPNEDRTYTVKPPLGARVLPRGSISALALVPNDDRGIVRGYRQVYKLKDGTVAASPGYALATLLKDNGEISEKNEGGSDRYLNFRYDFNTYKAGNIDADAKRASGPDLQIFRNKIVVIGATYAAARDQYATPVGPRFGCEIVGQEVQTELDGTSIASASRWLTGLLLVLGGFATVAVYHWFKLRTAFLVSLILIPLLSIASNWILFHRLSLGGAMVPLVSAVIIAELYAQASLYLDLLKKVSAANSPAGSEPAATDESEALPGPS